MTLTRRAVLAGAGGTALLPPVLYAQPASLGQIAAAAGLRFGAASDAVIADGPAPYAAAFALHCRLLAPNGGWHHLSADPAWEDPNVAFARRHGMALTGAHLLWHRALPPAFVSADAASARAMAHGHIRTMLLRYAGEAFSWNVVNEAIDTVAGDADGLRRSPLSVQLGPHYIADAFAAARAADPAVLLALNETQLEMATRHHAARRDALHRLLDRLQGAGAPIGAVGLQTHLRLDGAPFDPGLYRRFLAGIAARGLRILITEMDVFDIAAAGGVAQRDGEVADRYRAVLDVIVDEPAVASVVTWGLSDRYTWLRPQTDPAYRRADGLPARPLPLDAEFQPKPAFTAIAQALGRARPRTPA